MTSSPLVVPDAATPGGSVPGVNGPVFVRGSAGRAEEVAGAGMTAQDPEIVVGATGLEDVVAAMRYALDTGLRVSVQATGLGPARPCTDGLLVSTRRMDHVAVDREDRTAIVGAGARWGQVLSAAARHGLAPVCASSLDVGVVGLVLGGGLGPMARTFGFAADQLLAVEMVTADGRVRQADAETETELFWGMRGGKCELGVVTAMELRLMPVPYFYGGGLFFSGDQAARVLRAWRDWTVWLPDEVNTSIALVRLPDSPSVPGPLRGRSSVHLRYAYVGRAEDGEMLLEPLRELADPILDRIGWLPVDALGLVHDRMKQPLGAWGRGLLLEELPNAAIQELVTAMGTGPDGPLSMVEVRLLGGALARQPRHSNACGGREAAYGCYVEGQPDPALVEPARAAGAALLDALVPWGTGTTLVNFQGDRTTAGPVRRAWRPADRERLDSLQNLFDPHGVCRFGLPTRPPVRWEAPPGPQTRGGGSS